VDDAVAVVADEGLQQLVEEPLLAGADLDHVGSPLASYCAWIDRVEQRDRQLGAVGEGGGVDDDAALVADDAVIPSNSRY
jgi:hypothetical protein